VKSEEVSPEEDGIERPEIENGWTAVAIAAPIVVHYFDETCDLQMPQSYVENNQESAYAQKEQPMDRIEKRTFYKSS
jgi:hypothetical protein